MAKLGSDSGDMETCRRGKIAKTTKLRSDSGDMETCRRGKIAKTIKLRSDSGGMETSSKIAKSTKFASNFNWLANKIYSDRRRHIDAFKAPVARPAPPSYDLSKPPTTEFLKAALPPRFQTSVRKGDYVSLTDCLFTEHRDYLVYNDGQQVKAQHLAGKTVALFFDVLYSPDLMMPLLLKDVYGVAQDFEVVLVAVGDDNHEFLRGDPALLFQNLFSGKPWTAVPFSDVACRRRLGLTFGYPGSSIIVDPTGKVLRSADLDQVLRVYGPWAYPFTDERLHHLALEDQMAAMCPSLDNLLANPLRDYLISRTGEPVPIDSLRDKVVALYFAFWCSDQNPITKLARVRQECADKGQGFELVLIYNDGGDGFYDEDEQRFLNQFSAMPWLALPFKDPNCYKLLRIFNRCLSYAEGVPEPEIVIVGRGGDFVEPCGRVILADYGSEAYPFNRAKVAELMAKKVQKLKLCQVPECMIEDCFLGLQMLCRPTAVLLRKDGSEVEISELLGKRIMIYYNSSSLEVFTGFRSRLKERYLQMKDTNDEFEVIHISNISEKSSYNELVADVPWLVNPIGTGHYYAHTLFHRLLCWDKNSFMDFKWSLAGFDRDGRVAGKTFWPRWENEEFPYYCSRNLEEEAFTELNCMLQHKLWKIRKIMPNPTFWHAARNYRLC